MEIIGSLLADLFDLLFGRWLKGRDAAKAVKAAQDQAAAEANSGVIRDQTDERVEQARERNEKAIAAARADAGGSAGLQKQSDDVNAAITQANRELR